MLVLSVDDLPAAGVRLLSPAEPGFDAIARPLIGERVADVALGIKPMMTIVANDSERTIVSCSVVWHLAYADGRTMRWWSHTSFPNAVCGDVLPGRDGDALAAGGRRVHAHNVAVHGWGNLDAYYDQFLPQFGDQVHKMIANATTLRIELDAVIFEDGTLVGPDSNATLRDLFTACVSAKQARYRALLEALGEGRPPDEALSHSDRQLFMRDDWDELWSQQALGEATAWCRHHAGGDLRALIRETLRLEPFVVQRTRA